MKRRFLPLLAAVVVVVSGAGTHAGTNAQSNGPEPFEEADLNVEINETDGDAGLQFFLDHDAWRTVSIFRPNGRRLLDVEPRGDLDKYGLTELFSESSEPPFRRFPLSKFKALFPEGQYLFVGETIHGEELRSRVPLTHDFPPGPQITEPEDGSRVAVDEVIVRWKPVNDPGVVAYQVVVEKEDPLRVFQADLRASATELTVPPEFMQSGTGFKAEVLAIHKSGNATATEVEFTTK